MRILSVPIYEPTAKVKSPDADDSAWFQAVAWAMAIGFAGMIVYSYAERSWLVFACALLVALAAVLVGGLAGFVFGIPKHATPPAGASAAAAAEYEGNTSLEQISDWLTKILVGAGLVELKGLPGAIKEFGLVFADNKVMGSIGWLAAPALAITYAVCGFLLAYLWTRLFMIDELDKRKKMVPAGSLAAETRADLPRPKADAAAG